jgi:hypothetical protein
MEKTSPPKILIAESISKNSKSADSLCVPKRRVGVGVGVGAIVS